MREGRKLEARLIRRDQDDGSFDRGFWQRQGHEARFAAAWEMVIEAELFRGKSLSSLRLQRSVARLLRLKQ